MKIRAERSALADMLSWVAGVIPKNPPQPALAGLRLTASDGQLTARSFDFDVSHSASMDVDVADDGECLISGRFLAWAVGAMKGQQVELVLDDEQLTVRSGASTYTGRTLRIDDYPSLPEQPAAVGVADAATLTSAVLAVRPFINKDSPLVILQAVHLESDGDDLIVVGMRDAGANIAHAALTSAADFVAHPLPGALEGALRGLVGDVTIGFEDGVLGLTDGRRSVTMRTLEGEYAKWQRLVRDPAEDQLQVSVELADLADAVKRAGSLPGIDLDADRLAIVFAEGRVEISIAGAERGEGIEIVEADCEGGAALAMNPRFLLAALAAMPAGVIQLGVGVPLGSGPGPSTALNVRPIDTDDRLALVMPKKLPGGAQ